MEDDPDRSFAGADVRRLLPKEEGVVKSRIGNDKRRSVLESNGRIVADTSLWSRCTLSFDTDAIIDGTTVALFAAEVTLTGLYRGMSAQKSNLL